MIKAEVLEAEEDPIIGKTFSNRYRIDKILGEGGMGRVYVATQLSIGREVALKTLHAATRIALETDRARACARSEGTRGPAAVPNQCAKQLLFCV